MSTPSSENDPSPHGADEPAVTPQGSGPQPKSRRRRRRKGGGGTDIRASREGTGKEPSIDSEARKALESMMLLLERLPSMSAKSIRRRVTGIRRSAEQGRKISGPIAAVRRDCERMIELQAARKIRRLEISYPSELPISIARAEIATAIRDHQVVVICGETGSGKTTQLPKICLELGRGIDGVIGHTQPRRVAARRVAARIAEELSTPLGTGVGYAVRFNDRTAKDTRVKLMTDGILLAETQRDRELLAYDTIIIDEAHERSLNIDFLLGYLKRLLPRRPDLKVVITSATIDPERFSQHFDEAPIIRVDGRMHPVEIRYRPVDGTSDDAAADEATMAAVVAAVEEIDAAGLAVEEPSGRPDILIFLPGEREIHDFTSALEHAAIADTEILPLYSRLSNEQQDQVFHPGARRRIVLATNVAETSLTVPRIRGVIDVGTARIARYSPRSRVQRLPVEPIARSSANQRSGRCGRIAPGLCIRLCDAEEFAKRPEFTSPEIHRSNLASVILQMASLRLGTPDSFPFIEQPSAKLIRDGYETLRELGAVTRDGDLTEIGRALAAMPIDPRLGRVVLASVEEACVPEILAIVAALSVQDPRDRSVAGRGAADLAHAAFRDPGSDFLSFLRLWRAWRKAKAEKGSSALRNWCRRNHLSAIRMREWQDVHDQLEGLAKEFLSRDERGRKRSGRISLPEVRDDPPSGAVHRSILAGFVSNIGRRTETGEYQGITGTTFAIFPGSVLRRQEAPWIMAAEIVETSRRWARTVARIRADWVERVAPHLVRKSHYEPHFVPETGYVSAYERVVFGDLDLVEKREVPFAPIDGEGAREVFIQQALVAERLPGDPKFITRNRELREKLKRLGDRGREQGILADDAEQFAFYASRIPAEIHNAAALGAWRRKAERRDPHILEMQEADLVAFGHDRPDDDAYPDRQTIGGVDLALRYRHEPGVEDDGVTVRIPLELLGRLDAGRFEWLVPGLLVDKIETLIRSLPLRMRTRFMPIRETATGAAEHLRFGERSLFEALSGYLEAIGGTPVRRDDYRLEMLEAHHFMRFELVDAGGQMIAATRDFASLITGHRDHARAAFEASMASTASVDDGDDEAARLASICDRDDWDFGSLPRSVIVRRGNHLLTAFPAISDEGVTTRVRVTDDAFTAASVHASGVRRLLALQVRDALRHHLEHLTELEGLSLLHAPLGSAEGLARDLGDLAVAIAVEQGVGVDAAASARDRPAFLVLDDAVRRHLWPALERACDLAEPILIARQSMLEMLDRPTPADWISIRDDERQHLDRLVHPGFLGRIPPARLVDIPRYLETGRRRLDRLRGSGLARDRQRREELEGWIRLWKGRRRQLDEVGRIDPRLEEFGWLVEDYRVSLFAQELRSATRVSPSILKAAWASMTR
jgi:ATP-dependent helicase HrpA